MDQNENRRRRRQREIDDSGKEGWWYAVLGGKLFDGAVAVKSYRDF